MLCQHCEDKRARAAPRRPAGCCRMMTCERCGAAILTLGGVVVGVGDETLASLARFGLAMTGDPLLEPKRERA